MSRLIKIHCKNKSCNKLFMPKSDKNIFCHRRCFKKDYYYRKKQEEESEGFPAFRCSSCGHNIVLDFDPKKSPDKWLDYSCPRCKAIT